MKKSLNVAWKVVLILIIAVSLVAGGIIYVKRDEIVTSKITMKYFSEVVNHYSSRNTYIFFKQWLKLAAQEVIYMHVCIYVCVYTHTYVL